MEFEIRPADTDQRWWKVTHQGGVWWVIREMHGKMVVNSISVTEGALEFLGRSSPSPTPETQRGGK